MNFLPKLSGSVAALAMVFGLGIATTADASHGRGAAVVPSVNGQGLLRLDMVSYYRQGNISATSCSVPVDCIQGRVTKIAGGGPAYTQNFSRNSQPGVTSTINYSNADSRRTEARQTAEMLLPGAGTYEISWNDNAWVSGVEGASGNYGTKSVIVWDGTNANAPIIFDLANIQQEVERGVAYTDNLDATAGNGGSLSYSTSASNQTGVSSNPDTYAIDSSGNITIAAGVDVGTPQDGNGTGTYDLRDNGSNGADHAFEGTITNSDGSYVEFFWVFDGVDQGTGNRAPQIADLVINATVGDLIDQTITATDPNSGDTVTLSLLSFTGAGETFTDASGNSPVTSQFGWDTTGAAVGSYLATFEASDGSLTDRGTLRINLTAGGGNPGTVPLPAGMVLMGSALVGFGLMRRRKG